MKPVNPAPSHRLRFHFAHIADPPSKLDKYASHEPSAPPTDAAHSGGVDPSNRNARVMEPTGIPVANAYEHSSGTPVIRPWGRYWNHFQVLFNRKS